MYIKIEKFVKEKEGFCCLWGWLEFHRKTWTSQLMIKLVDICTDRALRHSRNKHRTGKLSCSACPEYCLKKKIEGGFDLTDTIRAHRRKVLDSASRKVA